MKIITRRPNGSIRVVTKNNEPSQTQQQFAEASDINSIMKKYHQTGMITHLNRHKGQYLDLSTIKDYQTSLNLVIEAQKSFMTLSSQIRARFHNDPQQLLNFLAESKNKDEAISLGLIPKTPPPQTPPQTPPPQTPPLPTL